MVGFLASLRRPACPCRNSAVVLLTEDCAKAEAETYLGRGANKVLTWGEAPLRLPGVLEDLLQVAPRLPIELPVRVMPVAEGRGESVGCRTVNISSSGMLLRVTEAYQPGTILVFEMGLPGAARTMDRLAAACETPFSRGRARESRAPHLGEAGAFRRGGRHVRRPARRRQGAADDISAARERIAVPSGHVFCRRSPDEPSVCRCCRGKLVAKGIEP